jgi:hypothetical protein
LKKRGHNDNIKRFMVIEKSAYLKKGELEIEITREGLREKFNE